jgi:MFS family permease
LGELSWAATAYLLTSTASTPLWGKLSDLYGRRAVFQAAVGIFVASSVLAALSTGMLQLVACRALQGAGGGGLLALAFAIVTTIVPARERGTYMGYLGAMHGVASVVGPLLGGWLTDGPGWRWIFWINVPIGAVAFGIVSIALRGMATQRRDVRIDWPGMTTIVAGVSAIVLYLSWRGPAYGWYESWALVLLGTGLLLVVAFVGIESKAAEPIIPLRLFRGSVFGIGNLFGFLFGFSMFGVMLFVYQEQGEEQASHGLRHADPA